MRRQMGIDVERFIKLTAVKSHILLQHQIHLCRIVVTWYIIPRVHPDARLKYGQSVSMSMCCQPIMCTIDKAAANLSSVGTCQIISPNKSMSYNSTVALSELFLNNVTTSEHDTHLKMWQPFFQENVMQGNSVLSYLVTVYVVVMFCFVLIKTTCAHGFRIWMIHKPGNTKFPKRPELLVAFCSVLPTMITIQSRAALQNYHNITLDFVYEWGSCQTLFFFDIFSRTANLYHMLYWTYSININGVLWKLYLSSFGKDSTTNKEKSFKLHCKRRIPIFIYFISLILSLPILIEAKKIFDPHLRIMVCARISPYIFYHYFDLVILIMLPIVLMIVRFYSSALAKNKGLKMIYRLRCYHVTFVLLTIPILVQNLVFEIFTALGNDEVTKERFANGVLISVTAYHTSFLIRPLVYTTGCNCICCGDQCLLRHPKVNRWIIYWSTSQHKENVNLYSQPIQVTID